MGRRRYSEQEEARLLGLLEASAVLTGDEVTPQYVVVGEAEDVPPTTLKNMWKRCGQETHGRVRSRLMREREAAGQAAGRAWFDATIANITENLPYITSNQRFSPVTGFDKDGREYVIVPGLRADQAARAYKDAAALAVTLGQRLGVVEDGMDDDDAPDLSTADGRDRMAEMVAALPPEVLAEAMRRQGGKE